MSFKLFPNYKQSLFGRASRKKLKYDHLGDIFLVDDEERQLVSVTTDLVTGQQRILLVFQSKLGLLYNYSLVRPDDVTRFKWLYKVR